MDNARELAARFLEALDAGQVPPGLRDELAVVGAELGEHLQLLAAESSRVAQVLGGGR